jgi:hypothetical protein
MCKITSLTPLVTHARTHRLVPSFYADKQKAAMQAFVASLLKSSALLRNGSVRHFLQVRKEDALGGGGTGYPSGHPPIAMCRALSIPWHRDRPPPP